MSDLNAALLCQTIYQRPEYFDEIINVERFYVGYKRIGTRNILVCRGSVTGWDWFHDLQSVETIIHPKLGKLGKGFAVGVDDAFERFNACVNDSVSIYGHSLGCAHGGELAGLFHLCGVKVDELVLFEPTHFCGQTLSNILENFPVRCYRNGNDPVCDVPFELDLPNKCIELDCPAVTGDITLFGRHHMPLIITALALKEGGYLDQLLAA
jgi:hypothetical protein